MLHVPAEARRPTTFRVESPRIAIPTVCVVDPCLEDFAAWHSASGEVQIRAATTAQDALRLARRSANNLWIVNCTLPDLTGIDLCQMLKSRDPRATVYLLANAYSVEQEQAAWRARANLFGVKPAHQQWLCDWLAHWRANASAGRAA